MAIRLHNLLAGGMGGIDWAGLPLAAEFLGIQQLEPVLEALEVVLTHRPPKAADED